MLPLVAVAEPPGWAAGRAHPWRRQRPRMTRIPWPSTMSRRPAPSETWPGFPLLECRRRPVMHR